MLIDTFIEELWLIETWLLALLLLKILKFYIDYIALNIFHSSLSFKLLTNFFTSLFDASFIEIYSFSEKINLDRKIRKLIESIANTIKRYFVYEKLIYSTIKRLIENIIDATRECVEMSIWEAKYWRKNKKTLFWAKKISIVLLISSWVERKSTIISKKI